MTGPHADRSTRDEEPAGLEGGVAGLVSTIRGRLLRHGALAAILWWGSLTCAVLTLAWVLAGSGGWEEGAVAPLLLLAAVVLGAAGAGVAFAGAKRSALKEERVVRHLEEARGLPQGLLRGSLELARGSGQASFSLAREAERSVLSRAGGRELSAGRLEERLRRAVRTGGGALCVTFSLVVLLLLLSPDRALRAWAGVGTSVSVLAASPLPSLLVEPGTVEVPRGDDLEVRIAAGPREHVFLHLRRAGEVPATDTIEVAGGEGAVHIRDVRAPLEYWVSAPDGDETPHYAVTPVDPVFLSGVRLEVIFPAHTGLGLEEYRGEIPPLSLPVGSEVRLEARTSRELTSASLAVPDDEEVVELNVDGRSLEGTWTPRRSGRYDWDLIDRQGEGVSSVTLPPLDFTLVADSVPQVEILFPERDEVLPLSRRQPLTVEARDDFGLERLEVVAYRENSEGEASDPVVAGTDLEGSRRATIRSVLDVTGWELVQGDEVRYYARAVDNHPSGQEARSEEFVLRVPSGSELGAEASRQLGEASERVESLAERARSAEDETRNLARQSQSVREGSGSGDPGRGRTPSEGEDRLDYSTAQELRQSLEGHEGIVDELESMREELDELARGLEEAGHSDPDLGTDLQELRDLLEQMTSPELRERLQDIDQALDDGDLSAVREGLRELMEQQSDLREGLDESLERFRRAAAEQEMRASGQEAEELAQEERRLAEAFEEGFDPQEGAQRQAELEERTEVLEERLLSLSERLEQIDESSAAEAARSSAMDAQEARQAMADAAAAAEIGDGEGAAAEAGEAAERLEALTEALDEAQQQMAEEFREALRHALEQTAHDALGLARRQADLIESMPQSGRSRRAGELQEEEAMVLQGLRNLAAHLAHAARMAPDISRRLGPALGGAMEAVEETVSALSASRAAGPSPRRAAGDAHEALNRLAHQALLQAEQAGEDGPSSAMESVLEQLEALAQQQGELQQESESLLPMEMGLEAMMEALQELAAGQSDVAGGLDDLAQQPGGESDVLGDLDEMSEEARDLAQELEGGRLDAETIERQERLFQRLLDAGRTLERDEQSDDREGTTAVEVDRPEVAPLPAELLEGMRFRPPNAAELEALSPGERPLVLEYFERLNRQAPPRAPEGGEPEGWR